MTDTHTQTAVDAETNAPAEPAAAVTDARTDGDDLDKLLAEYDESKPKPDAASTQPEQNAGTDTSKPQPDPAIAQVQQFIFRQDMNKTIGSVRGDLPADFFDDQFVESWINARAGEDPRLGQAWLNRHTNPKQFEKVVSGLGREFAKKYGKFPDKGATEDREAVTAAVRGASTRAPEAPPPDMGRMSDAEFQAAKDRMFG